MLLLLFSVKRHYSSVSSYLSFCVTSAVGWLLHEMFLSCIVLTFSTPLAPGVYRHVHTYIMHYTGGVRPATGLGLVALTLLAGPQ